MNFKLLFSISLFALLFTQSSYAQISTNNLVAQWDYNGNVGDSSGNANHGTAFNLSYGPGRAGKPNTAGFFNGSTSYVTVPYSSVLNMTNFTICATIKIAGFYTGTCQANFILQRGASYTNGNYGLFFADTNGSCAPATADTNAYTMVSENGPFNTGVPTSTWHYPYFLHSGTWKSVVATFNGTKAYIYMDGVVVDSATSTSTGPIGSSTAGLFMGAGFNGPGSSFPYWFNGYMDEIRLYNRILADSEITQFYTNIVIAQPYVNSVCRGNSFNLTYNLKDSITFATGTTFTAQLSNAAGSFVSPVNIGSYSVGATHPLTATIPCIIPAVTAAGTGYKIRIVTSNPQFPSSPSKNITVIAGPAGFSASSNTPICNGDTIRLFGSTSSPGVTWAWTGPNGFASTLQNPKIGNVTGLNAGDYILKGTLGSTACSLSDTETVTVSSNPAKPVAGSNSPVCPGATLNLTSSSTTSGVTYSWVGPNGYTSNVQNPSKTGMASTDAGNYIVTANLNGCISKDTEIVVVYPATPTPAAGSNSPVCNGSTLNLTAGTIPGATYSWTGPASYTSLLQNPVIVSAVAGNAGTYSVTATLNGCVSAPGSVSVTTVQGPGITAYPSPGDTVCAGKPIILNSFVTNAGTGATYQWVKNGANVPGATNKLYIDSSVTDGDTYYLTLTPGTGSACTTPVNTASIPIKVLPYLAPSVTLTSGDSINNWPGVLIEFNASPANAGTYPLYQWKLNGKNVIGATSAVWGATTLHDNDSVCIEVTSRYLCPNPLKATACTKVHVATGIGKINGTDVRVFPNPVNGQLHISGVTPGTALQLSDIYGRTVYCGVATQEAATITTSNLTAGTYILQLTGTGGERLMEKIVKE